MSRGLAAGALLALSVLINSVFATNTKADLGNTSLSLKMRVAVSAPSPQDLAAAEETGRLDRAMNVLSQQDAALYRTAFEAQKENDWAKANRVLWQIKDKRLVGSVMADRFERRGADGKQLMAWLNVFAAQPEAETLYEMALEKGVKNPPKPKATEAWGSGAEEESAADFSPDLMVKSTAAHSQAKTLARQIRSTIRQRKPEKARDLLIAAQKDGQLVGTFAADAGAVIAEAFFRSGERAQAKALATATARANQPLGLWISGLIAWEQNDLTTAHTMFDRLASHPALSPNNRAAAHFWAYRAQAKEGNKSEALAHLQKAASSPRSFYGLLASQLLGQVPWATLSPETLPKWNEKHRKTLAAHPAGWRALALIQVGQTAKAETELRRLNPLGNNAKKYAMLALADYVPMPALALRLASLSPSQSFDLTAYPLLPWQPTGGYVVDRALLFALARHESLFNPKATSSKGASGLMQIMPRTAHALMALDEDLLALSDNKKLVDPAFNMAVGQKYVQHLASHPQIGNNLMLLLAAYNGGPTKALTWRQGREENDPLFFLESIPVTETRNYIARVLPHYWAYCVRLGKPTAALKTLAQGQWPTVSLKETAPVRVASAND